MADLPLPLRSRRLQIRRDRLHNDLGQPGSLSLTDQTLPLRRSRGDTSLPFTDIDLERPFVYLQIKPETSQTYALVSSDQETSSSHPFISE